MPVLLLMPDFDPNDALDSQEQVDAYVNWCADNFIRLSQSGPRSYRSAIRCSAWLFVVASAQLHLDDDVEDKREELLLSLAAYQALGRAIERQQQRLPVERLIVLRGSLDCWTPVGRWAGHLLSAAKCAIGARLLIELYPLVDLWEQPCDDVWAMIDSGAMFLHSIDIERDLSFDDYAVTPDEMTVARYTWQRANNMVRSAGLRIDLGPN